VPSQELPAIRMVDLARAPRLSASRSASHNVRKSRRRKRANRDRRKFLWKSEVNSTICHKFAAKEWATNRHECAALHSTKAKPAREKPTTVPWFYEDSLLRVDEPSPHAQGLGTKFGQ
jgi:hypothetical protein